MSKEVSDRKQTAEVAGYTNPFCAACANMSTPTSKECKRCISETPAFNRAVAEFMKATKGTKQ